MSEDLSQSLSRSYAPAVLKRLGRLPSKDQRPIAHWLLKTPIGTNVALQIISGLEDLSKKEEVAPSQILTDVLKEMEEIPTLPKELGRRVRDHLVGKLHPSSQEHLSKFMDWLERLQLPRGVQLIPPKNFEGKSYEIKISFQDIEDLKEKFEGLKDNLSSEAWQALRTF